MVGLAVTSGGSDKMASAATTLLIGNFGAPTANFKSSQMLGKCLFFRSRQAGLLQ